MGFRRFAAVASAIAIGSLLVASAAAGRPEPSPAAAAPATAKPEIGDFGFDTAGMDRSIDPADDFFGYASGNWAKRTPIPADKASFGAFDVLQDLSQQRTKGILETAARDAKSPIGAAYAAYLDTAAIEAKGLAPIRPWLDKIKALQSKDGYAALVAEAEHNGIGGPFGSGVGQDAQNPDVYTVGLRQAGLGLPDRDYYLSSNPKLVAAKADYLGHLARMLTLAGEPDANARAQAIVDFETQIASVHWTRAESRDADLTYNKTPVADLAKLAPGFDFATYFRALGTPAEQIVLAQPAAIKGEATLIGQAPINVLRDQLIVRSLDAYADVLPKAFDEERFHFFGTVLQGTPAQEDRWKRAVTWVSGARTDEVSKLYVARYFPIATKRAIDQLVANIITARNQRIDKLAWMTPATKVRAHAKLAAFTPRIGYPDQWHDYSAMVIKPGDAFGNKLRANQWAHEWNAQSWASPFIAGNGVWPR